MWAAIAELILRGAQTSAGLYGTEVDEQSALFENSQSREVAAWAEEDALRRGAATVGSLRMKGTALAAKQRAAYSASGVDASVGTAADVTAATDAMTELEANTARNDAAREAWGFKQTQRRLAREEQYIKDRATSKRLSTLLGGGGGALGSVGSMLGGDK